LPESLSLEQLRTLVAEPPRRCDEVDGTVFGLSLASHNVLISLLLAAVAVIGLRAGDHRAVTA